MYKILNTCKEVTACTFTAKHLISSLKHTYMLTIPKKTGKINQTIAFLVLSWQQLWYSIFVSFFFFCYHTFFALRFNLAQMQAFLIIALSWQNLPHFKITSWCRQCDDNFRFQGQLTSLLPGFHCALVIAELLGDECYPPFSIPQTHNGLGRTFTCMT